MKPNSFKVMFLSVPKTLLLFVPCAIVISWIEIMLRQWTHPQTSEGLDKFIGCLSSVLCFCIVIGIVLSRGKALVEKKPIVPWLLSIPWSIIFTVMLVVCSEICYVSVFLVHEHGLSVLSTLPNYIETSYWKTGEPLKIVWLSVAAQQFLTLAFLVTSLCSYYGPVDESVANFVTDLFNSLGS